MPEKRLTEGLLKRFAFTVLGFSPSGRVDSEILTDGGLPSRTDEDRCIHTGVAFKRGRAVFLVDDITLFPVKSILSLFREIHKAAMQEMAEEADKLRVELSQLYQMLESGTLAEDAFDEREQQILDRLDAIEARDAGDSDDEAEPDDDEEDEDEDEDEDESDDEEEDEKSEGDAEVVEYEYEKSKDDEDESGTDDAA